MKLDDRSKELRKKIIALSKANGGYHFGGSFSCVEILRVLYDSIMGEDDIFILSKGHACWTQYVFLQERGFNPKLFGHPEYDPSNGVYATTGSLGHGLPYAVGIALAKKQKKESGSVYVLLGDGEIQEGTFWESALIAKHFKLNNLVIIIDYNGIQGSCFVFSAPHAGIDLVKEMAGISYRNVSDIDGHDISALRYHLINRIDTYPKIVICRTIKGKGVSFMENRPEWHSCWLDNDHEKKAMEELHAEHS